VPAFVLMHIELPGIGDIAAARVIRRRPRGAVGLISIDDPSRSEQVGSESLLAIRKQELRPSQLGRLWEQHRPDTAAL
jgi:hypothetical protein